MHMIGCHIRGSVTETWCVFRQLELELLFFFMCLCLVSCRNPYGLRVQKTSVDMVMYVKECR